MAFSEIVNVSISRETRAVTQTGFGIAMFLDRHAVFAERAQSYADLEEVVSAGFGTTSPTYLAAAAYFGSDVNPTELIVGRQIPTSVILTPVVANNAVYSVMVGSSTVTPVVLSFTSDGTATAAEIATGLAAAITAHAPLTGKVTASGAGSVVTLTKPGADEIIVHTWSSNLVGSFVSSETLVDAINAIRNVNDDWYGLGTYSHLAADITAVAQYINGVKKMYGYSSGDAAIKTTGVGHIAELLQSAGRDRTWGIYDAEAGTSASPLDTTTYGEMGLFGSELPKPPGSSTWMFKKVPGLSIDGLTTTESTNVRSWNCNAYERFLGNNMLWEGWMADGTYIDIVHGADWLEARMTERLFYLFLNNDKIPYTDAGVAAIESEVRAQLLEGVAAGYITDDFTITVPKVSNISANDKANRVLPAVKFKATLQGAVHSVTIQGSVQA